MSRDEQMTLNRIKKQVVACLDRMTTRYGRAVFDEWAIISLSPARGRLLAYSGPRREGFQANFLKDAGVLRRGLLTEVRNPGDFDFAREGLGTEFECYLVLGEGVFLICNNTSQTMEVIARDPLWISAQIPFVELSEQIRADPVELGEAALAR